MKKNIGNIICTFLIFFTQGCGTLGGFENIHFNCNKIELAGAIDSLYKNYPEYKIPKKWKEFDDWEERGYGFLDNRIFYFQDIPEEMYYVTFIGDSLTQSNKDQIDIAIRAVNKGTSKWFLNKDLNDNEIKRIENRLETEILSKLKCAYTKSP